MPKEREFGANKDSRQARKRKVCKILDLLRIKVLLCMYALSNVFLVCMVLGLPGRPAFG